MSKIIQDEKPSLESLLEKDFATDILEHHGIKGMHWGVRRGKDAVTGSYIARRSKTVSRLDRVATGKGSTLDKAKVLATTTNYTLARRGGLKGAAAYKRDKLQEHVNRVESGKATIRDHLRVATSVNALDVGRAASKNPKVNQILQEVGHTKVGEFTKHAAKS